MFYQVVVLETAEGEFKGRWRTFYGVTASLDNMYLVCAQAQEAGYRDVYVLHAPTVAAIQTLWRDLQAGKRIPVTTPAGKQAQSPMDWDAYWHRQMDRMELGTVRQDTPDQPYEYQSPIGRDYLSRWVQLLGKVTHGKLGGADDGAS